MATTTTTTTTTTGKPQVLRLRRMGWLETHIVQIGGQPIGYLRLSRWSGLATCEAVGAQYNAPLRGWLASQEIFHEVHKGRFAKRDAVRALVHHHQTTKGTTIQ